MKPVMGRRRRYVSKSSIRRESVTFGCSEHKGASSRRVSERRKNLGRAAQTETVQHIDQSAGTRSADCLRFLAEAEMRAVDPDEYLDMDDPDADDFEAIPGRDVAVLTWPKGAPGGQSGVFVSKESLRNPSSGVPSPDTTRH